MWLDTHQPNSLEESEGGSRRERARAYHIFEFEEFPGLQFGNGWTDEVEIWYVGRDSPAK